ncbi:MAG: gliding motility lipoprotein GldB, partial [Bacteroidia bacterium]
DLPMPEHHDSLKINYHSGQIEYCEAQEKNMWTYLIEEEVLFSSDKNDYQRNYFNEGPFTAPFGNDSPPRTGAWIGWQIVRKYMNANPEVTIHDLLKDEDHQTIFQKSGYRP